MRLAVAQPRSKIDGVRYTKALFVRETFRQLEGTTIPSWWSWIPKDQGTWSGGRGSAAQHHLRFRLPDNSIVDLVAMFEALGDQNVEAIFRGKEFNLLNLNEADTLAPDVLSQGLIRIMQGRYPGEKHVDPSKAIKQVNGDYNAPDVENYLYKLSQDHPSNYKFFRQPGGMDSNAENRKRATLESYITMEQSLIAQGRADLARRMIHNEYGYTRDGKPVYPEYKDSFHASDDEIKPVQGLIVRVDFDQGLHPAAILRQKLPHGQVIILDELYSEAGADGLCKDLKRLIGSSKYSGVRVIGGFVDPAAAARSGNDTESWVDCINRLMGWSGHERVRLAPTNEPAKRQGAVRYRLTTMVSGGKPALLISFTCKVLRKGFNSSYCFKRKRGGGSDAYVDAPTKDKPVSDVHDALQYGCLDEGGYEEVVGREKRTNTAFKQPIVAKVKVDF